ncbi:Ldh family oxidoreductase [Candidatus Poribacteria bacterium]|nr:Ldh family oxidoreductase [Candidatus Poribacteria bacterium]
MIASKRIEYPDLVQFIKNVLMAVGVPPHIAAVEAEIGAEVDLCGVHSHGVRLLPVTVENIRKGVTNPAPKVEIIAEYPASILAQADRGIGRYVSAVGMDMAMKRAEVYGLGAAAIRGVAHWGRGYSYALRAARAGMMGLAFTNAIVNFPAWGTSAPSLGNNPMAIGVPVDDGEPVVLDIAMTQTSIGRVRDAAARGQRVPLGWGLDEQGMATDDPSAIIASGRFLPMGAHKGSGLAFMIELLTAGLAGGLLCYEQGTEGRPSDTAGGSTKFFIAIKPFGDWLSERAESLKAHLKSAPPAPEQGEVQWPGEGSYRRRTEYLEHGIPLPFKLAADMEELGRELSVSLNWKA